MRALKRWLKDRIAEQRLQPRCLEIEIALQREFDLQDLPQLKKAGGRGHDSNYFVIDPAENKTIGVLRVVNPYKARVPPAANMPFMLEPPSARLVREWNAYEKGAAAGLTPKPLWRTTDAMMCEYLNAQSLQERLEHNPGQAWAFLASGASRIRDLHALGLTHMDMSLANMLLDEARARIIFIDFEYSPAFHLSPAVQRVYDHLRPVDSAWKFIPEGHRRNWQPWLDVFTTALDDEMKKVDLDLLQPALGRILQDDAFAPVLRRAIKG